MCLQLFGHRCWQYNPDLEVLFPLQGTRMSLPEYLERFLGSLRWAPRIEQTHVWSVAYCRTRGATGHPFLVVHLEHPELYLFPVRLKLRGFDGPINAQVDGTGRRRRYATLSVASVDQTMAELVGTRRYDVLHTMKFQPRLTDAGRRIEPDIGDLLTLAELAIKWDHSREGYPATLFSAMKTLFDNCVTSGKKGVPSASGLTVTPEMKSSVIDAFPTWRKRMQGEMDFRLRRGSHADDTWISELRRQPADLGAQVKFLEESLVRLGLASKNLGSADDDVHA